MPFADVGPFKIEDGIPDERVLFLSDIFPTGYMGAEMCDITPGDVVAGWGAGPGGQFAIARARLLGAERVIAIDRFPYRLQMAKDKAGATEVINLPPNCLPRHLLRGVATPRRGRRPVPRVRWWPSTSTVPPPL